MSQKIVICDECKHEFSLDAVGIHEAIVKLNNVPVVLVYFACPKCNRIYRVSIQDKRFYELKEDLEKTKKRIRKIKGNNKREKAEMLDTMVRKKLQRLYAYQEKVNEMFPGTFVFVTSENNSEEKSIKYLNIYRENHGTGGN